MREKSNQFLFKIATFIGLICMLIPLSIYGLWINAFNMGTSQVERVSVFNGYLPDYLQGSGDVTYLSMIFCVLAIILSSICLKILGKPLRVLNIIILIFASLLLLLNLFSIM